MTESRCRFEPPPEDDDLAFDIFGEDPFLVGSDIELVPKAGFDDLGLPKPEDAACFELDIRFGGRDPFAEEDPEEAVCCHIDNIEADLCDGKEGYTCMEETVRMSKYHSASQT